MAKLNIPISKGKDLFIEVDSDDLMDEAFPAEVFKEVLYQGLKQVLNRGMSKLASTKGMEGEKQVEGNAALAEQAQKNWEACKANEIRVTGGKAKTKGLDRAVKNEAMRLARLWIKDALKANGEKISHYGGKEITAAAEKLLASEQGEPVLALARENVEKQAGKEKEVGIDLSGLKPDPKLVKAAEEKAKKPKKEIPAGVIAKARQPEHARH